MLQHFQVDVTYVLKTLFKTRTSMDRLRSLFGLSTTVTLSFSFLDGLLLYFPAVQSLLFSLNTFMAAASAH